MREGPSFDVCAVYSSTTGWRPRVTTSVLLAVKNKQTTTTKKTKNRKLPFALWALQFERAKHLEYFPTAICANIDRWRFSKGDQCATFKEDDLWFIYLFIFTVFSFPVIYLWTLFDTVNWFKFHQDLKIFILFNILFNKVAQLMPMLLRWSPIPTLSTSSFKNSFTLKEQMTLLWTRRVFLKNSLIFWEICLFIYLLTVAQNVKLNLTSTFVHAFYSRKEYSMINDLMVTFLYVGFN